jgi:hypothetical protein
MEKLQPLGVHIKSIVEKVFAINGFTPEETALFYYWPKIVGDLHGDIFSIEKIENIKTTLDQSVKKLHLSTKERLNPIELSYLTQEIKEKIFTYFGFELIQEVRIKKGRGSSSL